LRRIRLIDAERTRVFSSLEIHCGRYPMRSIRTADPRIEGRHEEVFYIPHEENARLRDR